MGENHSRCKIEVVLDLLVSNYGYGTRTSHLSGNFGAEFGSFGQIVDIELENWN